VNKAARDILRQVLQAGFQYGIVGTDFPGYSLCLFIDLPGDRLLLATATSGPPLA
jgi:hypothetical protein